MKKNGTHVQLILKLKDSKENPARKQGSLLQKILYGIFFMLVAFQSSAQVDLSQYTLTYSDEFNGTTLDATKWNNGTYTSGYSINNELQGYQPENVSVSGGALHFKAEQRSNSYAGTTMSYASGMIQTYNRDYASDKKFAQKFGYFIASVKVPAGQGLWPAFWMLPVTNTWPPEIDIMEILGNDPTTVYLTQHYGTWPNNDQNGTSYTGTNFSSGYHTFAVDWQSTYIRWYVDGVLRHEVTTNIPQQEMFVILNLAVGGDWPGAPNASTPFPSNMDVDYVRCYQLTGTSGGGGSSNNIATSGTAYRWSKNTTAISNSNRTAATGINDGNTTTDIKLNNGVDETATAYESAGVTWSAAQSGITSVQFINGTYAANQNGPFSAGLVLQSSTDGISWTNVSGWSLSPAYSYNSSSTSGTTYTFSGAALSNIKGIRITGQVHLSATNDSWEASVREVKVLNSTTTVAVTNVSISPAAVSVAAGTTAQLTATITPSNATNQNVTWGTSNSSVATVSSTGLVTGVAAGTATITVTTQDGGKTATRTVTVTASSSSTNIAPNGIASRWSKNTTATSNSNKATAAGLNDGNATVDVALNNSVDETAAAYESAGVTWSTAQNNITKAEFVNGAYQTNQNGVFGAGLVLQSSTDGTTWTNVSGWTLSPAYAYDNASSGAATFTFTGTALSGIKGMRITGQVHISGSTGSWEADVREVRVFANSGSSLTLSKPSIKMYPNPVHNQPLTIITTGLNPKLPSFISIYNTEGKLILMKETREQTVTIPKEFLKTGMYIVSIRNGKTLINKKLVVE